MQRAQQGKRKQNKRATARKSVSRTQQEVKSTVGVSQSIVRRRSGPSWAFAAAEPHRDYPEGGCRLKCRFRSSYNTIGAYTSRSTTTGGFVDASFSAGTFLTLTMDTSTTFPAGAYNYPVFPATLRNFGNFFQRFRVREMKLTAVPLVGTGQPGRATLAYVRDPIYAMHQTTSYTGATFLVATFPDDQTDSVSFPLWQETSFVPIPVTKSSLSDELFQTVVTVGAAASFDGDSSLKQASQGVLTCGLNVPTPGTSTAYSDLFFDCVIDFYGFSGLSGTPLGNPRSVSETKAEAPKIAAAATSRDTSSDERYVLVKAEAATEQKQGSLLRHLGSNVRGS
jgi:hypothetical protein